MSPTNLLDADRIGLVDEEDLPQMSFGDWACLVLAFAVVGLVGLVRDSVDLFGAVIRVPLVWLDILEQVFPRVSDGSSLNRCFFERTSCFLEHVEWLSQPRFLHYSLSTRCDS